MRRMLTRSTHLFFIILVIVILVLTGIALYLYMINLLMHQIQDEGLKNIERISSEISSSLCEADYQSFVEKQAQFISARIIIVNEDYRLLADSHKTKSYISGRYITAGLSDAKQHPYSIRTVRKNSNGGLVIALSRMKITGDKKIIIQLVFQESRTRSLTRVFMFYSLAMLAGVGILVYLLVLYSIRQYKRPIHTLVESTKTSAGGMFSKISVDSSNREIIQIVENFNSLVDRYNLVIEADNKKYSRINTLLANMKAGIIMADTRNTITLVNPQAEKLLHLDKTMLFSKKGNLAGNNTLVTKILALTDRVNKEIPQIKSTLTTDSGTIIDVTVQKIFNKYSPFEHTGALVFLQDVTEMRKLEKLKDEFVSNVSHEFRTPLTIISGFLETLMSWQVLSNEERNTAFNIIEVETQRLKKLISELMILSRIEGEMNTLTGENFDPEDTILEVVSALTPVCKTKNHSLNISVQKNLFNIYGVESWFRQIIFNVFDNAIKYTPENGIIGISAENAKSGILIKIEDSGPGIPESERDLVFERFYRIRRNADRRNPGNGLGLSITKQMVNEFSGTIEIMKNDPFGSVFKIFIPLKPINEGKT